MSPEAPKEFPRARIPEVISPCARLIPREIEEGVLYLYEPKEPLLGAKECFCVHKNGRGWDVLPSSAGTLSRYLTSDSGESSGLAVCRDPETKSVTANRYFLSGHLFDREKMWVTKESGNGVELVPWADRDYQSLQSEKGIVIVPLISLSYEGSVLVLLTREEMDNKQVIKALEKVDPKGLFKPKAK